MNIEIFTLCKTATIDEGRLTIFGAFDIFRTEQVPLISPPFAIAIRIRSRKTEQGNKTLKITFMDTDGKAILKPVEQNFVFQAGTDVSTASVNCLLTIQQVSFRHFGEYSLDLAIDGHIESSIPLYVLKSQE